MQQIRHLAEPHAVDYAWTMDRRDGEPERLRAVVNGEEFARKPTPAAVAAGTRKALSEHASAEAGPA